jgi:hypothetical protein
MAFVSITTVRLHFICEFIIEMLHMGWLVSIFCKHAKITLNFDLYFTNNRKIIDKLSV